VARKDGRAVTAVLDLRSGRSRLAPPAATLAALSPDLLTAIEAEAQGWAARLRVAGAPTPLLTLNAAWSDRAVAKPLPFTYAALGRTLTGWILLPPDAPSPPPAVVWIYGGDVQGPIPPAAALPGRQPTPLFAGQLWAARGYAVIYPSTPLPAGADADIPAILAAQTEAAVAAAAARRWIDPGRVGLIGHSFGGYSVAAVLSRSSRFRAGVGLSGPYDFVSAWGARQPLEALTDADGYGFVEETAGFVEAGQIALKAPPYAAPEAYLRNSPLFAAPSISAPLLLMAGDLDQGAAGLTQAERLYAALRRAGRPAAMVRYWGQDHVQDDPWAVRDQWARATAWFDRYLAPCAKAALTSDRPATYEGPAPASASTGPRTPASPPS
jgi:dipeptidyl aminopeptidase/acylaminoacyl peptidase